MSYILDALKKSDQQRRRGASPTLMTPQATAVVPGRRISAWHILLAVLLIGTGILVGALRPWQGQQPAPAQAPVATVATERPDAPKPLESGIPPSPAPALPQAPVQSEQAAPTTKEVMSVAAAPPVARPVPPPSPVPTAAKPDTAIAAKTMEEQKVMAMAELPLSIQQEIPKMSISVHAYSRSSKDRLLGINDRMLREGDYMAPGLLLEQITPDGMIMSYKGYRFRHGVR